MTASRAPARKEPGFDDFSFKPWKPPAYSETELRFLEAEARQFAEANRSDPFAYIRQLHYLKKGIA